MCDMYITWLSGLQWSWESVMETGVCSRYNDRLFAVRYCAIKLWRVDDSSHSTACHHCYQVYCLLLCSLLLLQFEKNVEA